MKKLLAVFVSVLMLTGLLVGCGDAANTGSSGAAPASGSTAAPAATSGGAADDDTFVFVSSIESELFDPLYGGAGGDKVVFHQVYDTLLRIDEEGNLAPRLATEWEESEDGHSIIMKLRDDVTFHDGTPFTADDVVFTFETYLADELNAWRANYISECKKIDDYTIELVKGSAYAKVDYYLAEYPWIVSPDSYDPEGTPIGTGAYKFESQGSDGYVNLVANEDYWGGAPAYKKAVIRTPLDGSTAVVALQNGEIDMAMVLPNNQLPIIEEDPNLEVAVASGWASRTVMMAGDVLGGAENRTLRQAIAYAINRENAALFNDEAGTPINQDLWASKVMGEDYKGLAPAIQYDLEKAKELLDQSGYNGELITINASPDHVNICQSILADLQSLGLNVELVQVDMNTHYAQLEDGSFNLTVVDFGNDQSSTEDMLYYFASSQYYGRYVEATPEYDQLLEDMKDMWTVEERKPLVKEALEMQIDFANLVPLYEVNYNFAYQKGITGINPMSAPTYVYYFSDYKPA